MWHLGEDRGCYGKRLVRCVGGDDDGEDCGKCRESNRAVRTRAACEWQGVLGTHRCLKRL